MKGSLEAVLEAKRQKLETQYNVLASSLQDYIKSEEADWALNALSGDYMDVPIIEQFIKYLQAGRADNLKEAINLFEEEQHRGRVEKIQRATLETSQATAEYTASLSTSSGNLTRSA